MSNNPGGSFMGAYLVQGNDQHGPWAYVGKGDPVRARASQVGRRGDTVTTLAAGVTDQEALAIETAVIAALKATGVRLENRVGGHGSSQLTPAAVLAASLNPLGGSRRRLTLLEVGPALLLPLNLVHGHVLGDARVSVYRQWAISNEIVQQLRRLIRAQKVRALAVAPGDIVAATFLVVGLSTFPAGHPSAGLRYFSLAPDPDAVRFRGHVAPVSRQAGVRFLTPAGAGRDAFLALP